MKIELGDFNVKISWEVFYRNIIGNHSLYVNMNDNCSKLVDCALGKVLAIKSTMLPRNDVHKYLGIFKCKKQKLNRSCIIKLKIQK